MPPRPPVVLPAVVFARLGALLLLLAALVPSQALQAAPAVCTPVANNDSLAAFTDQDWQRLYVLDNDNFAGCSDPTSVTISHVTFAAHGQAVGDFYAIDYKPNAGYTGTDSFIYTLDDRNGHTDTATVTVHVAASGTASTRFAVYATSKDGYDSSRWTVNPKSGATSHTAAGFCNSASGLGIEDVLLQTPYQHMKAFDTGLTVWVNNQQVTPVAPMAVTHRSLVSGPLNVLGGVNVTVEYDGLVGSDTLRTRVAFANTSVVTKNFTATLASNVGSDLQTTIIGSSTNDTSFTTADRWLVTSDSSTNPGLIVDTHVLFGAGAAVTPSSVFTSTFVCNEDPLPNTYGVRANFHLSIPAGQTQRLLFFNQAHASDSTHNGNTLALADAAAFFTGNPIGLLGGISNGELAQIMNWKLGPISRLFLPLTQR